MNNVCIGTKEEERFVDRQSRKFTSMAKLLDGRGPLSTLLKMDVEGVRLANHKRCLSRLGAPMHTTPPLHSKRSSHRHTVGRWVERLPRASHDDHPQTCLVACTHPKGGVGCPQRNDETRPPENHPGASQHPPSMLVSRTPAFYVRVSVGGGGRETSSYPHASTRVWRVQSPPSSISSCIGA